MVERGTRGDLEALADLADGRRQAMLGDEPPDEAEHLALLARQLPHSLLPARNHTQRVLRSSIKKRGAFRRAPTAHTLDTS